MNNINNYAKQYILNIEAEIILYFTKNWVAKPAFKGMPFYYYFICNIELIYLALVNFKP